MWFADFLKNARKKTGLSQWEFALRSGINIGTLHNWEQGRNEPQIENIGRLIRTLRGGARPLLERLGITDAAIMDATPLSETSFKPVKPRRETRNAEKVKVR